MVGGGAMAKNRFSKFIIGAMSSTLLLLALLFFVSTQPVLRQQVAVLPSTMLSRVSSLWQEPLAALDKAWEQVTTLFSTYQENQALKKRLSRLENQEDIIADLKSENAALRTALAISDQYQDKVVVPTRVLVRSSVAWLDELTVDKGSQDGVSDGMLLVSEEGLVGHLSVLGPETSQVQLVTNTVTSSAIPIKINGSEPVYGVILGYDSSRQALMVGQLNSQAEVLVGSSVVTSGLDGEGPANLPVGEVLAVERQSDQSRVVYVGLAADVRELSTLSFVGRN